jgi:NAD(P)-dependent dehydrogenase (short-subunit alcohol dehydrogenase family)
MTQPDNLSLAGQVAIVTGASRPTGIGAAIATALARNGASVVINHVSASSAARAKETATKIYASTGANVLVIQADAGTVEGAKKLASETLSGLGVDHIDILSKFRPIAKPAKTSAEQ